MLRTARLLSLSGRTTVAGLSSSRTHFRPSSFHSLDGECSTFLLVWSCFVSSHVHEAIVACNVRELSHQRSRTSIPCALLGTNPGGAAAPQSVSSNWPSASNRRIGKSASH